MDSVGQGSAKEPDNEGVDLADGLTLARFVLHVRQNGVGYAVAALLLAQMGAAEAAAHAAACISG